MPIQISSRNLKQFEQSIINDFRKKTIKQFAAINRSIKAVVTKSIHQEFATSPIVADILSGELRADLGLTDPEGKIATIIDLIDKSVKVNFTTKGDKKDVFVITIRTLPRLQNILLNQPDASQYASKADGSPGKVLFIPWLRWLLIDGGKILVPDYYVKKRNPTFTGRSGKTGFMFPTGGTNKPFTIVKLRNRGVEHNNFITKILKEVQEDLEKNIFSSIKKVIR